MLSGVRRSVCSASISSNNQRGWIIPVGGAEKKVRSPEILRRFVELCGGSKAEIVILPAASRQKETGRRYERTFRSLDVREARSFALEDRSDCDAERVLEALGRASGVFLTGGNQLRLSTNLGGTPVAHMLRRRNAEGLHVAGTSAGAAFLCEHMIVTGDEGPTPRADMGTLAPGLGLTNRVIIDQHFRQRDRLGRLLTALAYNPFSTGIGLDEDTAAFIAPDDSLDVVGSGGITIVDPSGLQHSSMDQASKGDPVSLIGVRLHVLVRGGRYNMATREATPGDGK